MIKKFEKILFVTGTDTGVGKTLLSLGLAFDTGAYYWKPIQTGSSLGTDSEFVSRFIPKKKVIQEIYNYKEPLSPNQAAAVEDSKIRWVEIKKKVKFLLQKKIGIKGQTSSPSLGHRLVIEGAGGLFVPLNKKWLMIDLIQYLKVPVLLVARTGLGTLNHTLLSIEALRRRKIFLKGLVLIGKAHPYNKRDLEFYGKAKVLWELRFKKELSEKLINRKILEKEFSGIGKKINF